MSLFVCRVCEAVNLEDSGFCHYCGYTLDWSVLPPGDVYDLYCDTSNVDQSRQLSFLKSVKIRRQNVLVRRHEVFDRIQAVRKKIENIGLLRPNVISEDSRKKIDGAMAKMQTLLEALVCVRVEIEHRKTVGNVHSTGMSASSDNVIRTNEWLKEEEERLSKWREELTKLYSFGLVKEKIEEKIRNFLQMREGISLAVISGILSSTSAVLPYVGDFDALEFSDFDKESHRIYYEIDRIESEFTMN